MALKNLKSDLSKVNIPFTTKPLSSSPTPKVPDSDELGVSRNLQQQTKNIALPKESVIDKNISKIPDIAKPGAAKLSSTPEIPVYQPKSLLDQYAAFINNINPIQSNNQLKQSTIPISPYLQGTLNLSSKVQIANNSLIFGRHTKGISVTNNMILVDKLGLSVSNNMISLSKTGKDVVNTIKVKNKTGITVKDLMKVNEKKGYDVTNKIITLKKIGTDVTNNIILSEKKGTDVTNNMIVAPKSGIDVTNNMSVAEKTGIDVANLMIDPIMSGKTVVDLMHVKPKTGSEIGLGNIAQNQTGINTNKLDAPYPLQINISPLDRWQTSQALVFNNMQNALQSTETFSEKMTTFMSPIDSYKISLYGKDAGQSFHISTPFNQAYTPISNNTLITTYSYKPSNSIVRLFNDRDRLLRNNQFVTNALQTIDDPKVLNALVNAEYSTNKSYSIPGTYNAMTQTFSGGINIQPHQGYGFDMPDGGASGLPYIVHQIGETWYGNQYKYCPVEFMRGGIVTRTNRTVAQVERMIKFMTSPCGILWMVLQQGLQMTNPGVEKLFLFRPTRLYNPLSTVAAVAFNMLGVHPARHGFFGLLPGSEYEQVVTFKNRDILNPSITPIASNRLVKMWKEMGFNAPPQLTNIINIPGTPIITLSGFGGPNSVYGLGFTDMPRTTTGQQYTMDQYYSLLAERVAASIYSNWKYHDVGNLIAVLFLSNTYKDVLLNIKLLNPQFNVYGGSKMIYLLLNAGESKLFPHYMINQHVLNASKTKFKTAQNENDYYSFQNRGIQIDTFERDNPMQVGTKVSGVGDQSGGTNSDREMSNIKDQLQARDKEWNPGDTINYAAPHGYKPILKDVDDDITSADFVSLTYDKLKQYSSDAADNKRGDIYGIDHSDTPDWSRAYKRVESEYEIENAGVNRADIMGQSVYFPDGLTTKISPDFIDFLICNVQFKAIIKTLSYKFAPDWSSVKYVGRPDQVWLYNGVQHDVDCSFIAAAETRDEMLVIWHHLNELAQKVSPAFYQNRMVAPVYTLKIGSFIDNQYGFLRSLDFTIEEDTPWDIDTFHIPMYATVNFTFTVIGKVVPSKYTYYFANKKYFATYYGAVEQYNQNTNDQKSVIDIGKSETKAAKNIAVSNFKDYPSQDFVTQHLPDQKQIDIGK